MARRSRREILDDQFQKKLNAFIDDLFFYAKVVCFLTDAEIAVDSGLSPGTVGRLRNHHTQDPQLRTLWKLAHSLGFEMQFRKIVGGQRIESFKKKEKAAVKKTKKKRASRAA